MHNNRKIMEDMIQRAEKNGFDVCFRDNDTGEVFSFKHTLELYEEEEPYVPNINSGTFNIPNIGSNSPKVNLREVK